MNTILSVVIFIVAFLSGVFLAFGTYRLQTQPVPPPTHAPAAPPFQLHPPSLAIVGVLSQTEGDVTKQGRGAKEFEKIEGDTELIEGERLATGDKSSAFVRLSGLGSTALAENAQILLTNLIPTSFLLTQERGAVSYVVSGEETLSIRVLRVLYELKQGEVTVDLDLEGGLIAISQTEGRGKFALVDLTNETHVYEIEEGQTATIDNPKREVSIE